MEEHEPQPRTEVPPVNPEGTQESAEANALAAELQNLLPDPDRAMKKLAEDAANKEKPENPLEGPVKIKDTSEQTLQSPLPQQQTSSPKEDTVINMALKANADIELNKTPHPMGTESAEKVIGQVAQGVMTATEYMARRKSSQPTKPASPEQSPPPTPITPPVSEPLAA